MKKKFACSLQYYEFSPFRLQTFTLKVIENISNRPDVFYKSTLPEEFYCKDFFNQLIFNFQMAYANYFLELSESTKSTFKDSEKQLFHFLDTCVEYVDRVSSGNAQVIKLSGFKVNSTTHLN